MEMIKKFWKSVKAFFGPFSDKEIRGPEHYVKEETKIVRHTPRKKPNTRK